MKQDYFDTIKDFNETKPAVRLIIDAFINIAPTKGNRFGWLLSCILALLFSFLIGFPENTVEIMGKVANILLGMQLSIFGCVFAVYSILLAFFSDGFMKHLSKIKDIKKTSLLKSSTTYYESVLFLYFVNIGSTGIVLLFCSCVSPLFRMTNNLVVDTIIAIIVIAAYLGFSFRVFYEIKSTIYNTILLFKSSIAYKFIDFSVENYTNESAEKKE